MNGRYLCGNFGVLQLAIVLIGGNSDKLTKMDESKQTVIITDLESLDAFLINRDNSIDTLYLSNIPEACKTLPCIVGIDEAGRGPVLGPMVYAISFCPAVDEGLLKTLQCADSKALNETKRDQIFVEICDNSDKIGWSVDVIAPMTISNKMLSRTKISLNQISMDSATNLIRTIRDAGVNIQQIYVDTVGPADKYQAYLKSLFPDFQITVSAKADAKYPIVSAASICAKVCRDHSLKVWQFPEGLALTQEQFGSGYPSDPVTKQFLKDYLDPVFGYPQLVRFSWSTVSEALKNADPVEWDDTDADTDVQKTNRTVTSFFKTVSKGNSGPEHVFFKDRALSRQVDFEFDE